MEIQITRKSGYLKNANAYPSAIFGEPVLKPLLDPSVADVAPDAPILTGYDEERLLTYIRLLDAAADDADWREVARIVLHIDPEQEPERAFRSWETHLARARWMATNGYRYLLAGGAPH